MVVEPTVPHKHKQNVTATSPSFHFSPQLDPAPVQGALGFLHWPWNSDKDGYCEAAVIAAAAKIGGPSPGHLTRRALVEASAYPAQMIKLDITNHILARDGTLNLKVELKQEVPMQQSCASYSGSPYHGHGASSCTPVPALTHFGQPRHNDGAQTSTP